MIQFARLSLITSLLLIQPAFAAPVIDSQSGLLMDEGYKIVKQHCSSCHSPKLIIQTQATQQGWLDTIRWMQTEQGMSLLNKLDEKKVLDYLTKNYAPNKKGRRKPLSIKKWGKY